MLKDIYLKTFLTDFLLGIFTTERKAIFKFNCIFLQYVLILASMETALLQMFPAALKVLMAQHVVKVC